VKRGKGEEKGDIEKGITKKKQKNGNYPNPRLQKKGNEKSPKR